MRGCDDDLARFHAFLRTHGPRDAADGWSVAELAVQHDDIRDPAAVLRLAEDAEAGWLTLTDRVLVLNEGQWHDPHEDEAAAPDPVRDRPLAGALSLGTDESINLEHLDGETWRVTRLSEAGGAGTRCLARTQRLESILVQWPRYYVRTFWFADPLGAGYAPYYSRFLAFAAE